MGEVNLGNLSSTVLATGKGCHSNWEKICFLTIIKTAGLTQIQQTKLRIALTV